MNHLITELTQTLKEDERLVIDNKLAKNKVVELALAVDEKLIVLLLGNEKLKKQFFKKVSTVMVFDKVAFQSFVSNKQFLPDSYTAFKNKIGLTANNEYLTESNEVVLSWPYKDCVLEGGQTKEDQKRKEIFWNETLAPDEIDRLLEPKALTNFKKYDQDGEHDVEDIRLDDNLIIKGNNLLALYSLKKKYAGKVKLIYIDPPYNTGSDDFGYNDSFNHSTWLTFMRNRLEIAIELLSDKGMIWINIGDEESHYLKVLMDGLMHGKYVANIVWQKRTSPDSRVPLGDAHDHILVYANDKEFFKNNYNKIPLSDKQKKSFSNPDDDANGPWVSTDFTATGFRPNQMYEITNPAGIKYTPPNGTCWSKIESEYTKLHQDGRMWYGKNNDKMPRKKTYLFESEGITPWTWWDNKDVGHNQEAKHESKALFGSKEPFSTPKPERLMHRIISIATDKNDIVLDFFSGSGTTAAVAHKLERRHISVEQLSYKTNYTADRLLKVIHGEKGGVSELVSWQGGGSFSCCELVQNNADIVGQIEKAKTTKDLLLIWQNIQGSDFVSYKIKPSSISENVHEFEALSVDEQKQFLIAVLDKNQLYVNYSEINDEDYQVSASDIELNKQFYGK